MIALLRQIINAVSNISPLIAIIAVQTNFANFFLPSVSDNIIWSCFYFLYFALSFCAILTHYFLGNQLTTHTFIVSAILLLIMIPIIYGEDGGATKSALLSLLLLFIIINSVAISQSNLPLFLSGFMLVFNCIGCILDILYTSGFSNTLGRAAGLAINPNLAAEQILLATFGIYPLMPSNLKFLIRLVAPAGLFFTLSRASMLWGLSAVLINFFFNLTSTEEKNICLNKQIKQFVNTLIIIGVISTLALCTNDRFGVAVQNSILGFKDFTIFIFNSTTKYFSINPLALDQKYPKIKYYLPVDSINCFSEPTLKYYLSSSPPSMANPHFQKSPIKCPISTKYVFPGYEAINIYFPLNHNVKNSVSDNYAESSNFLNKIEKNNSAVGRVLYLIRSLNIIKNNKIMGIGLQNSFDLSAHNTFALMWMGLGFFGLLVCIILLFQLLIINTRPHNISMFFVTMGIMLTSHNFFLLPSMIVPLAICLAYRGEVFKNSVSSESFRQAFLIILVSVLLIPTASIAVINSQIKSSTRELIKREDIVKESSYAFNANIPRLDAFGGLLDYDFDIRNQYEKILLVDINGTNILSNPDTYERVITMGDGRYTISKSKNIIFSIIGNERRPDDIGDLFLITPTRLNELFGFTFIAYLSVCLAFLSLTTNTAYSKATVGGKLL